MWCIRTLVAVLVLLTACASDTDPPEALGIREIAPGTLVITFACSDFVSASVIEGEDEVRIGEIEGTARPDLDCESSIELSLEGPLGTRSIAVNDERWNQHSDDCFYGPIRPTAICGPR